MKQDIVMKFVEAINNQDLPLIIDMMSEDFYFIDTYGNKENSNHFSCKLYDVLLCYKNG